MHGLADGWLPPEGFTRPSWDAEGLVGARPVWGRFWDSATGDEDAARLTRARHAIAEWLAARPSGGGDFGLIHADLVRENVLVDGAGVSFIDFDDCGFGFRLFDIATALLKNIDEPDLAALQEAVIASYSSLRALPDGAKDDLPWFMAIRALTYLGWANDRPDEPGMPARRARFHATSLRMLQAVGL
jgi:Ser/Thr protein kinase RdoA (MazF antagonist)